VDIINPESHNASFTTNMKIENWLFACLVATTLAYPTASSTALGEGTMALSQEGLGHGLNDDGGGMGDILSTIDGVVLNAREASKSAGNDVAGINHHIITIENAITRLKTAGTANGNMDSETSTMAIHDHITAIDNAVTRLQLAQSLITEDENPNEDDISPAMYFKTVYDAVGRVTYNV
jgi:hypothetical protein